MLLLLLVALRPVFFHLFDTPAAYLEEFGRAYLYFAITLACIFPLGLFNEMLQGLQRLDLSNWIRTAVSVVNFVVIWICVTSGVSFSVVVLIAGVSSLFPSTLSALFSFRLLPGLSLNPYRYFEMAAIREQLSFSVSAYLIAMSNRLLLQLDRIIVGAFLSVGAVANYQAAAKVAEILRMFASNLEEAISPAAAHLRARGDSSGLRDLLLRTSRFNFLIITPIYFLGAVYMAPVISVLTDMEDVPKEIWIVGQLLLFAVYNTQISSTCASGILMMTGHERPLVVIVAGQLITNVGLSIALVLSLESIGVALATFVCSLVFGWAVVLPKILKTLEIPFTEYASFHFRGAVPGFCGFGVALAILVWAFPLHDGQIASLLWRGLAVLIPTMLLNYRIVRSTWSDHSV